MHTFTELWSMFSTWWREMTKENQRSVHGNQDTAVVKSVQKMCISKYSNECAFQVQWGRCAIQDRAAKTCNSENSRCFVWNPTFSFSCSRKLGKLSLWLLCCHGNDRDFVAKRGRLAFFTIGLKKDWFSPQSWTSSGVWRRWCRRGGSPKTGNSSRSAAWGGWSGIWRWRMQQLFHRKSSQIYGG